MPFREYVRLRRWPHGLVGISLFPHILLSPYSASFLDYSAISRIIQEKRDWKGELEGWERRKFPSIWTTSEFGTEDHLIYKIVTNTHEHSLC